MAQEKKVPGIVNGHDSRSHLLSTDVSHHGRRICIKCNVINSILELM